MTSSFSRMMLHGVSQSVSQMVGWFCVDTLMPSFRLTCFHVDCFDEIWNEFIFTDICCGNNTY